MDYHGIPLSSTQGIRLLSYLGSRTSGILACRLEPASINESYYALSYVWGSSDPENLVCILCNGESFRITPNLHNALSEIWRQFPERRIWADALCINQEDHAERASQVANMGNIYKLAECVMVWWGRYALYEPYRTSRVPDSEIEYIFRCFEDWATRGETDWLCDDTCTPDQPCAEVPRGHIHKETARLMAPGRAIWQGEWLERMWTMQEICVARRAVVHLGACSLRWDYFVAGLGLYTQRMPCVLARDWGTYQGLKFIRSFGDEQAREGILSRLLDATQLRRAMEPRDKIYALLGLLPVGVYTSLEKVSYQQSVESLYAEVSRLCWEVDNATEMPTRVFSAKDYSTADLWLPSWSVDWSFQEYVNYSLKPEKQAEAWKFHPTPQSSIHSTINQIVPESHQLRVYFIAFARLFRSHHSDRLLCESFPRCTPSQRECYTKPAQVHYKRNRYGGKETVRVNSEDVSKLSQQSIDAVEILKSIHDHETSVCTCTLTNVCGPKASAASWPLGKRMCETGRVGDWLGFLANRNGHTCQRSVLLRPETSGCFHLAFCGRGSETIELLEWSDQTVPQNDLSRVEKDCNIDYFLTQLTLI